MSKYFKRKKLSSRKYRKRPQRVWKINLDKLTSKQNANYEDSLDVLNQMRHGVSLSKACKQVGISPSTVKRYVGLALTLQNHRWIVEPSDRLLRKMEIYVNGKPIWVTVRGIKQARIIGQYHSAIGRLENDKSSLKSFEKVKIRDMNGKFHRLETDITKIFAILERREGSEFYKIYGRN